MKTSPDQVFIVTGCAGFIGSNLVDRLLADGKRVVGIDNFSTGQRQFLAQAVENPRFSLIEADLLDTERLNAAFAGGFAVFHLAANADVRFGTSHPGLDLQQNTIATFNVLEAMRANGITRILFSSTGSVYGEATVIPTPEDCPFPVQTSLYAASKVASEGLISAYCEGFGFQAWIFRFVSILGERYTHGHVFDFCRQLAPATKVLPVMGEEKELTVLGNGKQRKSYLYVHDCIDAMFLAFEKADARVNILNLGVDGYCELNDSIFWISHTLNVLPSIRYTGGDRGWVGDNPFIYLDTTRIRALGWVPKHTIPEGVVKTVQFLQANPWVLEAR